MRLEHWLYILPLRLRSLLRRSRAEQELDEEIRYHVERLVEENISRGMTPDDAREAAMRAMDNLQQRKEECRDTRRVGIIEDLFQDLRYALRVLRNNPILTSVVVLSLALGIGANTAIFSVMNAVMLRMLPVQEPGELVLLEWSAKGWPQKVIDDLEGGGGRDRGDVTSSYSFSSETFKFLSSNNQVFASTFAFAANDSRVNIGIEGHAYDALVQAVSGNYFGALGVPSVVGRSLLPSDDAESAPAVAVVSYNFWQHRLAGDPGISGKSVMINGNPVTIVGVAPSEFFGLQPGTLPDLWMPLTWFTTQSLQIEKYDLNQPKVWWLGIVGRLDSGITQSQAHAELAILFHQSLGIAGTDYEKDPQAPNLRLIPAKLGLDDLRAQFSKSLLLLMGMVALVLLIACANVAGLLLARTTARQREIATRLSLGAPRSRIIRQLLTESALLAVLGGSLGVFVSRWAGSMLVALLSSGRYPIHLSVDADIRVLVFTVIVSLFSGVLFGLAPAMRATRVETLPALKQTTAPAERTRFLSGKVLVSGQMALCLLLLMSAGLFLRTLKRLQNVEVGFDRQHLLVFQVMPGLNGYTGDRLPTYYEELQRRIGSIPGIHSVGLAQWGPINAGTSSGMMSIPGYTPPGRRVPFYRHWISPGYFEALGVPMLMGRTIGPQDVQSAPRVVVINQRLAREYFHNDNPIGHRLNPGSGGLSGDAEIVGVVRDIKYGRLRADAPATAYLSYLQGRDYPTSMTFQVRSQADPAGVISAIQNEALSLDKDVPLVDLRTETEVIDQALFLERTFATLSTSFGLLALLLACVGLYGTIGYTVSRRTSEIGIRMALGAERWQILTMVLRETLMIVFAGLAAGFPLTWIGTRLVSSHLFGLSPHDPATIVLSIFIIAVVAITAGYIPARRASQVDPMVALRYE